jgi:serine/threonine protein kinase
MHSTHPKVKAPAILTDPVNGKTYTMDIILGSGGFGDVYKYICNNESSSYAIKVMNMNSNSFKSFGVKDAENEVSILRDYGSNYTCKYVSSFRDSNNYYIVMEYCSNGSLDTYVKIKGLLTEKQAVKIMLCMLNALEHLHENGIIHRDIKPANILLNEVLSPQLADMGLSSKLGTKEEKRYRWCGTKAYMAPEVFNQSPEGYNYKSDLWSLAVSIYTLVFDEYPQKVAHSYKEIAMAKRFEIRLPDNTQTSLEFKSLLGFILKYNPEERPTIDEIRCHYYMKSFKQDELPQDVWKAIQSSNINRESK